MIPNPGSDDAIELGCTCPVMDNHHGKGRPDGLFWMTQGCPVHDVHDEGVKDEPVDDGNQDS